MQRTIFPKTLRLGVLILLLCAGTAGAERDTGTIRSQQEPSPSSILPSAPQSTLKSPTGPSNPILEIPGKLPDAALSVLLPSSFVGCWQGTIEGFDSLTPIGLLSSHIQGAHVTYRFCYVPNPNSSSYRLELRKLVIAEKEFTPTSFENQVVWTDDHQGTAYLRNHLVVIQHSWLLTAHPSLPGESPPLAPDGDRPVFIPISVQTDYYAEEIVTLDNSNLIKMRGAELMKLSGTDYARIGFHADFRRVPDEHE
jgi:hypothetical protein